MISFELTYHFSSKAIKAIIFLKKFM